MRLLVNMETEIHSIEHVVDFMLGQCTDIWDWAFMMLFVQTMQMVRAGPVLTVG